MPTFMTKALHLVRDVQHFNRLIKTHGSGSRGQEEAGLRDEPVNYLQVALL